MPLSGTANSADFSTLASQIADFELSIEESESTYGRFSYLLAEPLTQLAASQIDANRFDDAHATLERAIKVTRVSHGLFTEKQYDLLQMAVDDNRRRGDWEAVNKELHHIAWLYFERYDGDTTHLLKRVMWLSDTHVSAAFNDNIDNRVTRRLAALQFRPALLDGVPVAEQLIVDYRFRDNGTQQESVLVSTR